MALELRNRLMAATSLRLASTFLFDYPTPRALVDRLATRLFEHEPEHQPPIILELDRLEASLLAAPETDATRAKITARLRALLSRLNGSARDDGAGARPSFELANDEELFSFVDQTFAEGQP